MIEEWLYASDDERIEAAAIRVKHASIDMGTNGEPELQNAEPNDYEHALATLRCASGGMDSSHWTRTSGSGSWRASGAARPRRNPQPRRQVRGQIRVGGSPAGR